MCNLHLFFCLLTFSVHLEVLASYENEEVGLLKSENHDLPLLHRHAQQGHKSHSP